MHNTKITYLVVMWALNVEVFVIKKSCVFRFEPGTLVEKSESHVVIGFLLWFFFLFFFGSFLGSGSSWSSTTSTASSGGGTNSGSDVRNEVLDVYGLEALGEKARPERLHGNVSSLQDGTDLLGGDGNIIVSEDQGGVDTG